MMKPSDLIAYYIGDVLLLGSAVFLSFICGFLAGFYGKALSLLLW